MTRFASYDGTEIGYRVLGDGPPLICLPGGPGRAGEYLGDLGGLARARRLIIPDSRGVGLSADPVDPATFRADRIVEDVEALRVHLGLERMDLLAHSAGAIVATLYAADYPDRLSKLILVTPGLAALDVDDTENDVSAALALRKDEPWYPSALAAMEKADEGDRTMETYRATRPFYYGRWDETTRGHALVGVSQRNQAARDGFFADVTFGPPAIRASLAKLTCPVLLYGGDMDTWVTPVMVREAATVFRDATVTIQPETGHFPWVEDPEFFAAAVSSFLAP
jgi:pimeloyl-ACP methyl ester carboxylesterase